MLLVFVCVFLWLFWFWDGFNMRFVMRKDKGFNNNSIQLTMAMSFAVTVERETWIQHDTAWYNFVHGSPFHLWHDWENGPSSPSWPFSRYLVCQASIRAGFLFRGFDPRLVESLGKLKLGSRQRKNCLWSSQAFCKCAQMARQHRQQIHQPPMTCPRYQHVADVTNKL